MAEAGTKPDLGPTIVENQTKPQKIAGLAGASMEFCQDYPELGGWIQQELQRSVINAENNYLLNAGAGGGPSGATFTGLTAVSGTLTRSAAGTNGLDAIAMGAMDLRASSAAYAEPDLLILHPQTVTALMITKDDSGRYLLDMLGARWVVDLEWQRGGAGNHHPHSWRRLPARQRRRKSQPLRYPGLPDNSGGGRDGRNDVHQGRRGGLLDTARNVDRVQSVG